MVSAPKKKPLPMFKTPKAPVQSLVRRPDYEYSEYKRGLFDTALLGVHKATGGDSELVTALNGSEDLKHAMGEALGAEGTSMNPYTAIAMTAGSIAAKHYAARAMKTAE